MAKFKQQQDPFAAREAEKYENPIPSREYILEYLANRGSPATYPQLLDEFELESDESQEALRRRLIAMVRDGQLLKNRRDAYGPLEKMELVAGRVIGHKDGCGFVVPDTGGDDLFLNPKQMRNVFHGDRVLVRVENIDTRGRREAMIVEVLEHNTQQLVGRLQQESGIWFVEPSNRRINQDILIPLDALKDAQEGQMVVVALVEQPGLHKRALGEIVEVLGDHMAPGMEISVAIRNHELPTHWPEDALLEASRFKAEVPPEAIVGRKDFRHLPFVTIDGDDAKDFDDAVYCVPREKGGYTLCVAIADVSYYVQPNSALDKEAYKRGNSVYFPGRVIPMLPEVLSNGLCSLNPKVDRLVMVCEMTIHPTGRIMKYEFSEGVIHSHARLTYNQVHAMMEKNDRKMRKQFAHVVDGLEHLYALFNILHKSRQARGAIDFDMPETKIVFGKDKKIEKIIPYERFLSHRVIEECMLAANICAAKILDKNKMHALYRVHQGPNEEKLNDLRRFLNEMALRMPGHREPVPADYAHLLRVTKDRPDARMIQTVLLRSMSQAVYSSDNKGHFGLAYDAYTHFTSPIRRYPDLLVHRAIKHVLKGHASPFDDLTIAKAGEHCSTTERRADDATHEVTDWLKAEFMMDKVGNEYEGVVAGVTSFGIFVELKDIYVEGLVHISTLPEDYYQFDPAKHALIGDRTGRQFRLGDTVKIKVARVDLDQCQIDFVLAEGAREKSESGRRPFLNKKENESRAPKRSGSKPFKKPRKNNKPKQPERNAKKQNTAAPAKKKRKRSRK
jgi:ribonuclease R